MLHDHDIQHGHTLMIANLGNRHEFAMLIFQIIIIQRSCMAYHDQQ